MRTGISRESQTVDHEEFEMIVQIARRAAKLALESGIVTTAKLKAWRVQTVKDLAATHASGVPLRLDRLLAFPDDDLCHDVFGIATNIDRETGKLLNCFLPRCAP